MALTISNTMLDGWRRDGASVYEAIAPGEAGSVKTALNILKQPPYVVAIAGLFLEDSHGIDLIKLAAVKLPKLSLLAKLYNWALIHNDRVLKASARAVVPKSASPAELRPVILGVLNIKPYLSPVIKEERLFQMLALVTTQEGFVAATLSDQKFQVFELPGQLQL